VQKSDKKIAGNFTALESGQHAVLCEQLTEICWTFNLNSYSGRSVGKRGNVNPQLVFICLICYFSGPTRQSLWLRRLLCLCQHV